MPGEVRAPRLQVTLDGVQIAGALAADIHSNNHFGADRFRVRLAASASPQEALHVPGQRIEVAVGVDGTWARLIVGLVDRVCFDPDARTLDIEGRDLSSTMIEAQADETFANRTSSEIATMFAGRHGLGALVTQTTTPVGRYYQSEHDSVTLGQFAKATTEWDLLAFLAAREGFELFMLGDSLWFGPSSVDGAVLLRAQDCISLQLDHAVGLARTIEVTVRSWGTKAGTAITATARSEGAGELWKHAITRPNLTSEDAQKLAQRTLDDLRRHEWTATALMPGDVSLTTRSRVSVVGTGTAWDRDFAILQLSRHIDARQGFTQRISLQGLP